MSCIEAPLSRLTLEQYALGELSESHRKAVRTHLETCAACSETFRYIETDARPLPPLRSPESAQTGVTHFLARYRAVLVAGAAAALMIAFAFVLRRTPTPEQQDTLVVVKGGDIVLSLVRERDGVLHEAPTEFDEGDRFKLFVSRPGAAETAWELAVFQGTEVYFPLSNTRPLPSGNRIPLPGALALDGTAPADLCLFLGPDTPSRHRLRTDHRRLMPQAAACVTLKPTGK